MQLIPLGGKIVNQNTFLWFAIHQQISEPSCIDLDGERFQIGLDRVDKSILNSVSLLSPQL